LKFKQLPKRKPDLKRLDKFGGGKPARLGGRSGSLDTKPDDSLAGECSRISLGSEFYHMSLFLVSLDHNVNERP
jgi:hypothetical protein